MAQFYQSLSVVLQWNFSKLNQCKMKTGGKDIVVSGDQSRTRSIMVCFRSSEASCLFKDSTLTYGVSLEITTSSIFLALICE